MTRPVRTAATEDAGVHHRGDRPARIQRDLLPWASADQRVARELGDGPVCRIPDTRLFVPVLNEPRALRHRRIGATGRSTQLTPAGISRADRALLAVFGVGQRADVRLERPGVRLAASLHVRRPGWALGSLVAVVARTWPEDDEIDRLTAALRASDQAAGPVTHGRYTAWAPIAGGRVPAIRWTALDGELSCAIVCPGPAGLGAATGRPDGRVAPFLAGWSSIRSTCEGGQLDG